MTRDSRKAFVSFPLLLLFAMLPLGTRAEAADACRSHFEVAGASGAPVATTRATRTSDAGTCDFAVRLRADGADACAVPVTVRGLGVGGASLAEWRHVTLKQRARRVKRKQLRARIAGGAKAARLTLRCAPPPALDGCEDVLAESTYCYLGGGYRVRVAGLTSGSVCRDTPQDMSDPAAALQSADLAVWNGEAYTCSLAGAFVATPVDGGAPHRVAGRCAAVTTDGDALLVLPGRGFDEGDGDENIAQVRAYDLPESVPGGPFQVAFDLDTIPPDSPCTGRSFDVMTARDGIIYASGCGGGVIFGECIADHLICIFDTHTGTVRDPIELKDFNGAIRGMSAIGGGRLVVLTNDQTPVPPTGYFPPDGGGGDDGGVRRDRDRTGVLPVGGADSLHVFDTTTGARLDTRTIESSNALGLACVSRDE